MLKTTTSRTFRRVLAAGVALTLVAAACAGDDDDSDSSDTTEATAEATEPETEATEPETEATEPETEATEPETEDSEEPEPEAEPMALEGRTIKFWSTETQPERLDATQAIIDRFEAETGANVELTAADENQLPELMLVNAASGTLPDVVFHPVDFTTGWAAQGLLDVDAAAAVVDNLGADTFSAGALELVSVDGTPAAVPSDGWGQLLVYRKDLFDAAGLAAPDSFDNILAAAAALHDPDGTGVNGITAATSVEVFTQQTWEHMALANGCELTDGTAVTLDTPNCVEAIDFYTTAINDFSVEGVQDVVSTRATYFAGEAAMIVWSPFILDEMAGLRDSAFPSCDECADNPAFLAENSGIVTAFSGPSGSPAQYGQVSSFGVGTGGDTEAAQAFIEFWLSDGYLDWLAVSPEGKLPLRRGNAGNPTEYLDGWKTLETGVDRRASLVDFYGEEIIDTLIAGTDGFNRWGFPQNQGELVAAIYQTLPVPEQLSEALAGKSGADAAADMQARAEEELALLAEEE